MKTMAKIGPIPVPAAMGEGADRLSDKAGEVGEGASATVLAVLAPVGATASSLREKVHLGRRRGKAKGKKKKVEAKKERKKAYARALAQLQERQEKLEKRLRKEKKHSGKAGDGARDKVAKRLRRKRKRAEKALRRQQEKVKSLSAGVGAKLAAVAPGHHAPPAKTRSGIDRLLGEVETGRFEKMMSALTAVGAAITAAEIWSEHDGASFGNKMMWLPVIILPVAVPVGVAAVFSRRVAKTALPALSLVVVGNGLQGMFFHWRGIVQKPGGLRKNFRYNVEMGPPAMAPLLASLVGGMGILAALLRREDQPAR